MATQICPNCKANNFTWKIDEEESLLTFWFCLSCKYGAFENESEARTCLKCGRNTESKLKDSEKEYWWCSNCNTSKQ